MISAVAALLLIAFGPKVLVRYFLNRSLRVIGAKSLRSVFKPAGFVKPWPLSSAAVAVSAAIARVGVKHSSVNETPSRNW
jgi:hypothetical protein